LWKLTCNLAFFDRLKASNWRLMEGLPLFGKNVNLVQRSSRFFVTIGAVFFVVCAGSFYPWSALLLDGHATGTVVGRFQTYGRYPSHQVISQGINYRFVDESENSQVGSGEVTRDFYESVRANAQVEIRYWRVFPIINLLAATASPSVLTVVLAILTLALGAYSVWTGRQISKTACWPWFLGGKRIEGSEMENTEERS
jgi:hypothetical protein